MMDIKYKKVKWGPGNPRVRTSEANWKQPRKWAREAEAFQQAHGRRQRVFCASLADVFDNEAPAEWRRDLFALIDDTPELDWLLLTKRIGNVSKMLAEIGRSFLSDQIWLGATIVNQEEADRDIPKLLQVEAKVRFLSMEPLLGPVEISELIYQPCPNSLDGLSMDPETGAYECCSRCDYTGISDELGVHWIIAGGESGRGARPMHPAWARTLRDECKAAEVQFLFKQWGDWQPAEQRPYSIVGHRFEDGQGMVRLGKKHAGRLLDGRTWDGVPA